MEVIRALLRLFSFFFHAFVAVFLIAIPCLALGSGIHDLHFDFLPVGGPALPYILIAAGVFDLVCIVLAIRGMLPILFFLWSILVALVLLKGFVFSSYRFTPGHAGTALALTIASLVAIAGAWPRRRARERWSY